MFKDSRAGFTGALLLLVFGALLILFSGNASAKAFMADPSCGAQAAGKSDDADLLCTTGGCDGEDVCGEIFTSGPVKHKWCGCPGETESNCCHLVILVSSSEDTTGVPMNAGNCTSCVSASGYCCLVVPIPETYNAECLTPACPL